jgi:hypothetical protein
MFTWICPKCGKEVPPAYSECPNCAPSEQPAAPPPAQPPVAQSPQPAPPEPVAPAAAVPVSGPPVAHRPGHVSVPGWLLSLLIGAVLIIVVWLTLLALRKSPDTAAAPAAASAPIEAPGPAAAGSSPVLRNVELAGLRLIEDEKHKPFVQAIVVNHSAADLGELKAKVNLHSGAKQTQGPVGSFSFKASLGPYESKEIKAPLTTTLRVYELPDWQFLRAEIVP